MAKTLENVLSGLLSGAVGNPFTGVTHPGGLAAGSGVQLQAPYNAMAQQAMPNMAGYQAAWAPSAFPPSYLSEEPHVFSRVDSPDVVVRVSRLKDKATGGYFWSVTYTVGGVPANTLTFPWPTSVETAVALVAAELNKPKEPAAAEGDKPEGG